MGHTSKLEQRFPDQRSRESAGQLSGPAGLSRLFDEWMQGDEKEQRDTFETLRRSLDENRRPGYKLFPQA